MAVEHLRKPAPPPPAQPAAALAEVVMPARNSREPDMAPVEMSVESPAEATLRFFSNMTPPPLPPAAPQPPEAPSGMAEQPGCARTRHGWNATLGKLPLRSASPLRVELRCLHSQKVHSHSQGETTAARSRAQATRMQRERPRDSARDTTAPSDLSESAVETGERHSSTCARERHLTPPRSRAGARSR